MNNSTLERDIDLEATTILSIIRFDSIDRQFDYVKMWKKKTDKRKKRKLSVDGQTYKLTGLKGNERLIAWSA